MIQKKIVTQSEAVSNYILPNEIKIFADIIRQKEREIFDQ